MRAQEPHETLRDGHYQRIGHQVRVYAHIRQTGYGAPGRVGVDRREEQVSRQRRPHGHLGRRPVADLTQHDDVGVLPQEGTQCGGERQADLLLELHLVDPFERVLDRILDREDVVRQGVQPPQRGVERRALARARRAADQHHAEGPRDGAAVVLVLPCGEAEVAQFQQLDAAGQQSQHDLLAVDRRQRRDAHVELLAVAVVADAPVLRQPFLGDVERGEDLDLVYKRHVLRPLDDVTLGELAVDAHTDAAALFVGFEVDVAGVVAQRLAHQREEELPPLSDLGRAACGGACRLRSGAVMLQQKPLQVIGGDRHDFDLPAVEHLQLLGSGRVVMSRLAVAAYPARLACERHKAVLGGLLRREQAEDLRGDMCRGYGHKRRN